MNFQCCNVKLFQIWTHIYSLAVLQHGTTRLKNHFFAKLMKLWPREKKLVRNILKLEYPHQVTSEHWQWVYVWERLELTKTYRGEQEPRLILGSRGDISLKLSLVSLFWQKKLIDGKILQFSLMSTKMISGV